MNLPTKPGKHHKVYNFMGITTGIFVPSTTDMEHFSYYYGAHEISIPAGLAQINIYFSVEGQESFIQALFFGQGSKQISYSFPPHDEKIEYERFDFVPERESIIPPVLFFNPQIVAVHASAFSFRNRAFLLMGPGYSGKSYGLLSLCEDQSFGFLADDLCVINLWTKEVHPFFRPIGLRPNTIRDFKWLGELNADVCKVLEIGGKNHIVVAPDRLPVRLEKEPLHLGGVLFLGTSNEKESTSSHENIHLKEAHKLFSGNLQMNSLRFNKSKSLSFEQFESAFTNIPFFKLNHNIKQGDAFTDTLKEALHHVHRG
mgnify:CR=1 FL=1